MSTSDDNPGGRVKNVRFSEDSLSIDLMDGREITAPLSWYPRLWNATPDRRANWETCGAGYGIHWPAVDEHLGAEGLLRGAPARRAPGGARK